MHMKTDIQIAQEAAMLPVKDVAAAYGIKEDDLELYGKYKAKLTDELWEEVKDRRDAKLVLVTAINPTPAGEGKTTTSVGLGDALSRLGKKTLIALREPSLGPCFGIKGGAAGGGYAQVVPMEDLNLHFTGDFHAITSANNLLAALLDNHIQQGNALNIDTRQILWKRCLDMNDRVLRNVVVGLGAKADGVVREDHFVITVASEIMAILCLADNMADLKDRLGRIIVAYNYGGEPVTAKDLNAVGAMAAAVMMAALSSLGISRSSKTLTDFRFANCFSTSFFMSISFLFTQQLAQFRNLLNPLPGIGHVAESVFRKDEGDFRSPAGIRVALGIPYIDHMLQAVFLHQHSDGLSLGDRGLPETKVVPDAILQSCGPQEELDISALAVAYNVEICFFRQCMEGLDDPFVEHARVRFQIFIFIVVAGFHDPLLFFVGQGGK